MPKFKYLILAIFTIGLFFAGFLALAQKSPDVIALKVMPNPDYASPTAWYQENIKVQGAPQSLIVDGYEAVRDGRSVYVNAANVTFDQQKQNERIYTNIYIMSYNQDADATTTDIFGQLLTNWKFNVAVNNLDQCAGTFDWCDEKNPCNNASCVSGNCSQTVEKICLNDSDCPGDEYCDSRKARLVRDVKRLSDLRSIKTLLERYRSARGYYPKLEAGSYLPGRTISTWPSWNETLGAALGAQIPIDQVNLLGRCATDDTTNKKYNPITCWDENAKQFADPAPNDIVLQLPANSRAYVYQGNIGDDNYQSYSLCGVMESGYVTSLAQGACLGSTPGAVQQAIVAGAKNRAPAIVATPGEQTGKTADGKTATIVYVNQQDIKGWKFYVKALDPDNDDLSPLSQWSVTSYNSDYQFNLANTALPNVKLITAPARWLSDSYLDNIVFSVNVADRQASDTNRKVGQKLFMIVFK